MTPTLRGRWQTRLFLLLTVGIGISAIFGLLYRDFQAVFSLLGYIFVLGVVWDVLYFSLQSRRWDHDWSPALYFVSAVWEVVALLFLIKWVRLPGVPPQFGVWKLIFYFGAVWICSMGVAFGPMRIIFPRWRFWGGQWF